MARVDFLIVGASMILVGTVIAVEVVLSRGLLGLLELFGVSLPCVVFLVLGVAAIKIGMRPKDLPNEPDNTERDASTGT